MNAEMLRLLAEASALAGGEHPCAVLGHKWEMAGGRACPRLPADYIGSCSQAAYVCAACGLEDYGEPGGPGHTDCFVNGPCDLSCEVDSEVDSLPREGSDA